MAQLRVRLRGKPVYNLPLEQSRSYIAGRKEDCDIVLQPEKGISREHFKLFYDNETWNVEVVSRYGEVHYNGQSTPSFTLENGNQFSIAPYEFEYLEASTNDHVETIEPNATSANLPAVKNNEYGLDTFDGNDEKTVVGVAPPTVAHIKIVGSGNETKEIIRLDAGDTWLAGRDPSCHIQIKDQRVSRRQFEIRQSGSQFYIIDLGSVNGTLVNGNVISSIDATSIKSGDAISVLNNFLYFELHDANFQNRIELVKASGHQLNPLVATAADALPMNYQQPMPYHMANGVGMPTPMSASIPGSLPLKGKFDYKKNRPKVIAAAVLLLGMAYFFSDSGNQNKPATSAPTAAPGSPMEIFLKLKPEQQALIKQRYKDAKNLYMQGKYQLAQDEIIKIQELVPDYEDIKEIERLSKEAIFIQDQQRRQEELEKSKIEIEEKIQKQADECQKKINPAITMAQMEDCLSPVMQFDPEHARILNLKNQVEKLIADKEAKAAERAAYQDLVDKMRAVFKRAQQVHKNGKPLDAIAAYEKVLKSQLPDPQNLKSQARQNIESIRKMMGSKTAALQAEADKFYQSQNLKGAIMSLRQARIIDPSNMDLPEKIERYTTELRKQMMVLYQEGILAESFGEIEGGAKDKWKKILESDVPDGEYYKKALIKLKKYGAL